MARFDVHRLKSGALVVDLQSSIIDGLETRVVAPLLPLEEFPRPVARLNPEFDVDGMRYVMVTHMLGAISSRDIHATVSIFAIHNDAIIAATDFLFQGF